jgi:hypothetical protein
MKRNWAVLGVLIASLWLAAMTVAALGAHSIDWWVVGGGGGSSVAGNVTLGGTVGQTVTGTDSNGDYDVCAGFWCRPVSRDASPDFRIYLPTVLKE